MWYNPLEHEPGSAKLESLFNISVIVADPGGDFGEPWIPPFQASYTSSIVLCSAQRGLV